MKKIFNLLFVGAAILGLASCGGQETTGGGEVTDETIDVSLFEDLKEIRLSSYQTGTEVSNTHNLKQIAPYDDTYKITTNENTKCEIFDTTGKNLLTLTENQYGTLDLKKDEIVYT